MKSRKESFLETSYMEIWRRIENNGIHLGELRESLGLFLSSCGGLFLSI